MQKGKLVSHYETRSHDGSLGGTITKGITTSHSYTNDQGLNVTRINTIPSPVQTSHLTSRET